MSRWRSGTTGGASIRRRSPPLDLAAHLGIVGMRERVRARAGAFQLTSRPGAGTTVEIELPV